MNVNVSHVDGIIPVNNGHGLVGKAAAHLIIQHLDNGNQLRHAFLQIRHRPFLQGLSQNGVVGVGAGPGYHINGFIHIHSPFHQKTDQLRNDHGGMGVIDLDYCVIRQIRKNAAFGGTLIQNQAGGIAYHKILLVNAQLATGLIAVIRIEKQRQVPGYILLVKGDGIFPNQRLIDAFHIKKMELICAVLIAGHLDVIKTGGEGKTVEGNLVGNIGLLEPGRIFHPGIGCFLLQVIFKYLLKKTEMII